MTFSYTVKMLVRSVSVGLAMGLAAGAAFAQQPAAPAAPPAAAPAQAPMVLPVITPTHFAAARAVVISSGLSRSFQTIVPELMGQLFANITQTRPDLTNDLKAVLSQLQPEFQAQTEQIVDAAAQSVAGQMDEASLKQVETFFTSPAGKKYVDAQPEMLGHMMESIHGLTDQMSERMLTRVREEMKKRGKDL